MKKIFIYSLVFALFNVACTDLEETVFSGIEDVNFPEDTLQSGVIHLASYRALDDLFDDGGWWFLTQEMSSDEMVGPTRAADWYDGGNWVNLQYHSWNEEHNAFNGMWNKLYQGIGESNEVLELYLEGTESEAGLQKKAEVETIRSLYYYWLIDNFGDVPYLTSFFNAPEQPYRTARHAIFDSLTVTLDANYGLLNSSTNSIFKSFANREMALTLLAKLHLNAEVYKGSASNDDYQKVITYCDMVLNSGLSLEPNVMDLFSTTTSGASNEMIYYVPFHEANKEGFRFHMRSLGYISKETYNMTAQPWNGFAAIPDFFHKYEDGDVRKGGYFQYGLQFDFQGAPIMDDAAGKQADFNPDLKIPEMSTANMLIEGIDNFEMTFYGARVHKYEIYAGALENLTVNFPIFRLADVVFMKAEAELRLNGVVSGETMELVNQIWTRANQTPPAGGLTLSNILDERGKELFAEAHRRSDMIRFGTFDKTFWGMNDGKTGVLSPVEQHNIFPIPLRAKSSNPNLEGDIIGM